MTTPFVVLAILLALLLHICECFRYYRKGYEEAMEKFEDKEDWVPITSETQRQLQNHHWYLIAHKEFATPLKARFHRDGELLGFTWYDSTGKNGNYLFEEKITHFTKLLDKPDFDSSKMVSRMENAFNEEGNVRGN